MEILFYPSPKWSKSCAQSLPFEFSEKFKFWHNSNTNVAPPSLGQNITSWDASNEASTDRGRSARWRQHDTRWDWNHVRTGARSAAAVTALRRNDSAVTSNYATRRRGFTALKFRDRSTSIRLLVLTFSLQNITTNDDILTNLVFCCKPP